MKKLLLFTIAIIMLVSALGCASAKESNVSETAPELSEERLYHDYVQIFPIEEYSDYFDPKGYDSGVYFGEISTAKRAAEIAEELWIEEYGPYVVKWRPYTVQYNEELRIWHVKTTGEVDMLGGVYHAMFAKDDGELLAVYVEE